jgi:hypothetical protein
MVTQAVVLVAEDEVEQVQKQVVLVRRGRVLKVVTLLEKLEVTLLAEAEELELLEETRVGAMAVTVETELHHLIQVHL